MSSTSLNSKKTIKQIRRGLAIYKTGRSPFWHARIYDSAKKTYVVKSTKETTRLEAAEVAEEIYDRYKRTQNTNHATVKERSFRYYGQLLDKTSKANARFSRNKYAYSDVHKILYREEDGLLSYFGQYDVGKITSGMVRDYLVFLDQRREKPLAPSTKSKQCGVLRRVARPCKSKRCVAFLFSIP